MHSPELNWTELTSASSFKPIKEKERKKRKQAQFTARQLVFEVGASQFNFSGSGYCPARFHPPEGMQHFVSKHFNAFCNTILFVRKIFSAPRFVTGEDWPAVKLWESLNFGLWPSLRSLDIFWKKKEKITLLVQFLSASLLIFTHDFIEGFRLSAVVDLNCRSTLVFFVEAALLANSQPRSRCVTTNPTKRREMCCFRCYLPNQNNSKNTPLSFSSLFNSISRLELFFFLLSAIDLFACTCRIFSSFFIRFFSVFHHQFSSHFTNFL